MDPQQQNPGAKSGPPVKYAGYQKPLYPGTPAYIHPLPIGMRPMHPGLGPRPLYPQVYFNGQWLPGVPQGYPRGPNVGFYNGTVMIPFPHPIPVSPYAPFVPRPGNPPSMTPLTQDMSQLQAPESEMVQGNMSHIVPGQYSPGQGGSGPLLAPDLNLPERHMPRYVHIPEVSRSHYADISPNHSDAGDSEPELQSRGVFLRDVPRTASYPEVFRNIRGGTIDQVSFQDREGPLMDVNVFFTTQQAAKSYADYVTEHGGIFWHSERFPSHATLIPSKDDGFLSMDQETAKAIADGFTRCVSITGIPVWVCELQLRADIQSQTRRFRIEYESFEFKYVDSTKGRTAAAEIRFPSVKICLASIETLKGLDAYKECVMTPVKDECAGSLSELGHKWKTEYEWCKSHGIFRDQRFPVTISKEG